MRCGGYALQRLYHLLDGADGILRHLDAERIAGVDR